MPPGSSDTAIAYAALNDQALVALAREGHDEAFRHLMQRCNQRLFRVARGVMADDAEAEDVVQEAYAHAFTQLDRFRHESAPLTWMTRIVLNEAYGRLRRKRLPVTAVDVDTVDREADRVVPFPSRFGHEDPAASAARAQIRHVLEEAIDALPRPFRIVLVLRDIEGCSVEETASHLGIRAETVKTRLHRARRLLRAQLQDSLAATLDGAFPFLGPRCARMTEAVLARLDAMRASIDTP